MKNMFLTLCLLVVLAVSANASMIITAEIDDFSQVDTVQNDGNKRQIGFTGFANVFVELDAAGLVAASDGQGYFFQAIQPGGAMSIRYTWDVPGTLLDAFNFSDATLDAIPQAFAGNWNLVIEGGAVGELFNGPALVAPGSPISLNDVTELEFTFTWSGGGPGIGQFGNSTNPLNVSATAVPEPSSFVFLGLVALSAVGFNRLKKHFTLG